MDAFNDKNLDQPNASNIALQENSITQSIPNTATIPDASASSKQTPYSVYSDVQKTWIILLVSVAATFSGFASNIYFPSIPTIASDLSVSTELVNLTVTGYLIFQGLSPTIWGAVSDTYGRRVTYICTFVLFIGACIGLGEAKNYAQLLVLRCLQSTGSASTIAIGAGVVGDITRKAERGSYMGFFQAGLLVPVAFGPLIGGALADSLGWRAIFWFLSIYGASYLAILVIFLPETLRSLAPPMYAASVLSCFSRPGHEQCIASDPQPRKKIDLLASASVLAQPQAIFSILFVGLYYMIWQMVVTVLSSEFKSTYGLSDFEAGLVYIANGCGCILGTLTTGKILDMKYHQCKERFSDFKDQDFPLEKARLSTIWVYAPLQCTSVLVFGWVLEKSTHISAPIICLFFIGWSATSIQSVVSTILVDLYPDRGASATAALNIVRCLLGAAGTAAVSPSVKTMGVGWTFTLFSGITMLGVGLIMIQYVFGPRWRLDRMSKSGV